MNYQSTRNKDVALKSMEIIKQGISADGGLFVPIEIPRFSTQDLHKLIDMTYVQRAIAILSLFLTDFSLEDLTSCVHSAYGTGSFDSKDVAPVISLSDDFFVQELWHGPTCAFKDMALQLLPHLMSTAVRRTGEDKKIVVLVATSGDTGKAALEGFKDVEGIQIIVFYPEQGVSPIQKLQMVTQEGNNVFVAAVKGNFDDAQTGVKNIFTDESMIKMLEESGYAFSSANSINWGRLVPQIVYYISAYLDLLKKDWISEGEEFNVVVPTGNFGNILAAYYAKKMGIPIGKLICASNKNKVLADFINTGIYDRRREFYKTISPSMDILISSNLERLLFELSDKQDDKVRKWMMELKERGVYKLDSQTTSRLQDLFWGGYATEEQTMEAIRQTYNEYGYVLDPHTAVGKWVYDAYRKESKDKRKTVLVSTASPFKFASDVLRSIVGEESIKDKDDFMLINILSDISRMEIPAGLRELDKKPVLHNTLCSREDMKNIISSFLALDGVVK